MSLALLVGLVWVRHLRGAARGLAIGWFGLVALSIFTTYQHHFIDGVAGAVVGVVCVYLLPARGWPPVAALVAATRQRRYQLAAIYGLGAALSLAGAGVGGGWAWLLLWPATALGLVALAYGGLGPAVSEARGPAELGRPAAAGPLPSGRVVVVALVYAPARPQLRGVARPLAGPRPRSRRLAAAGPGAVLDLTAEFGRSRAARARPYLNVPLLDLVPPSACELTQAVAALDELLAHPPVLVHCALGYSRGLAWWPLGCCTGVWPPRPPKPLPSCGSPSPVWSSARPT